MYGVVKSSSLSPVFYIQLGPQISMRISEMSCLVDEAHEGLHSLPVSQNLQTKILSLSKDLRRRLLWSL